jgi:hypothetical protein
MLLTLEEIGLELMMVLAVAGSIACLVFLIRTSWLEWRGSQAPRKQASYSASASDTESRRGGAR